MLWKPSGENTTVGNMALTQDFKKFVALLNENDVRYLIVGGYAVAFHGYPRYTKDLDIWIDPAVANIHRLLATLGQFGFGSLGLKAEDFEDPEDMIQLGLPPNRIDLFTALKGVTFDSCYEAKVDLEIDEITAHVIDLYNLKQNKKATGRPQDVADLLNLT